ncbi:hypothetical protein ONE63_010468 [Megalurothrips usitatus]|uniref:Uncharacterized protein n=1 Tax=Megalurothrips usitatus TaxID=439358 RepID=A0AAV7XCZ1_9NEOP|nr:hypothetical protein ONE63_010468 [Megalurothrips usitatus]
MQLAVALLAAALAAAAPADAAVFDAGAEHNRFIVTFSIVPDPFNMFAFFDMPRTTEAARKDHFAQEATRDADATTVWCRYRDYRVCVLFDGQGSVAGIQVSVTLQVRASEIEQAAVPKSVIGGPEWYRQTLLGEDVYTATAFFVPKATLTSGGRAPLTDKDPTAPDGVYILQTDASGAETGRLHVTVDETDAAAAGFTEQACFYGMGKHYFQELRPTGTCEAHRPYFLLYGPKTQKLNGLGFTMFGKPSKDGRGWFEAPSSSVAKKIAPNSPDCMTKWIDQYGLFTLHVYFVGKPFFTRC